ncbi:hypothetical protein J3A83DRAFT_4372878 [Scleroderma citrinum]
MVRSSDVVLILVAIIFPPAAAGFITGCSCDLFINICLTILGYIPGHLVGRYAGFVDLGVGATSIPQHAFWLIYKKMEAEERYGHGGFIYVGNGSYQPLHNQPYLPPANYGTVNAA